MIRKALGLLGFAGFVVLAACGGDDEDSGPKFGNLEAFCEAQTKEKCAGVQAACAVAEAKCLQTGKSNCVTKNTGKAYQPGSAESCVSKTRDFFNGGKVPNAEQDKELEDICGRVFGGTKKANEACNITSDCATGLVCTSGFCGTKAEKAEGNPCNNPGDTCVKGTYCGGTGNKTCLKRKGSGELCSAAEPCVEDLRCGGTCRPKSDPQSPCDKDDDCASAAPYCDPLQKKCLPKFTLGSAACKDLGG